jgi:hypothetical protein
VDIAGYIRRWNKVFKRNAPAGEVAQDEPSQVVDFPGNVFTIPELDQIRPAGRLFFGRSRATKTENIQI